MKLSSLFKDIAEVPFEDCDAVLLTDDSRKICDGCIYVCIKGGSFDGHDAAAEALEKGACCVVTQHNLGFSREITVPDTREIYGKLCARWFGNPENELILVGVTGTNGKTTITNLIKFILEQNGQKTGLIGTICHKIGDEIIPSLNTTPMAFEFFGLLRQMADKGCKYAVCEVSSFGLAQRRVGSARFRIGLFTNLTEDHLDYHKDMDDYFHAKQLLFKACDIALCNIDDTYGEKIFEEADCEKYSYSVNKKSDFYADLVKYTPSGSSFWLCRREKSYKAAINMPGGFNVSNALAAIGACVKLGFPVDKVIASAEKYTGTRGRCEVIPTGRDFTVICDYAHTPDALENILSTVKGFTENRLICLFGCGGNRDRAKRPIMAQSAARYSDFLVITSDNPRNEAPDAIIDDIMSGLDRGYKSFVRITDRREAIEYALKTAKKGDVIVLAGKGHEDYQVLADGKKIHFDEREVVKEGLGKL